MTRGRLGLLLAAAALGLSTALACDSAHKRAPDPGHVPAVVSVASSAAVHGAECDGEEHAAQPHPPVPTATALSDEVRRRVSVLRIFAHSAAVIIRKGDTGWSVSGPQGCQV